jgi:MoxR-like ATPase
LKTIIGSGDVVEATEQVRGVINNINRAFVGKDTVVTRALLTLISGGHLLLEDAPGLGKTLLAKALAQSIEADFKRIQFTADLLPSDITGVSVFAPDTQQFTFHRGPVFANVLLGDEINRATPRTQSSLLEAMEEEKVTVDGVVYALPSPFFVVATQNPIELEGTYPLPFAQMDRFMVRLRIGYLERQDEIAMLQQQRQGDPLSVVQPVMDCARLAQIQQIVRRIRVEESLQGYIVDLVQATRTDAALEYGSSPRGSLDVQTYSQAIALWEGREYVLPDDIKQAAGLVLPHRLIVRKGTRQMTAKVQDVMNRIVDAVPVPI